MTNKAEETLKQKILEGDREAVIEFWEAHGHEGICPGCPGCEEE